MKDLLFEKFFEPERWHEAIDIAFAKGIDRALLTKLTTSDARLHIARSIASGQFCITPPHTAEIPKDEIDPDTGKMKYRTVYINEGIYRIFLSIANNLLFELMPERVHKSCTSYQKGIGCGKVVQNVSRMICGTKGDVIGFKADLSKYFDSVPIEFIDGAFDMVEAKFGHSTIIDVLRKFYHCDLYFDKDEVIPREKYQSLKQGCAVASWLADVILYHIDERLSSLDGYYVRYSDDILFVGPDHRKAKQILSDELSKMRLTLNPKKVEDLRHGVWFKFLGFSIKDDMISLSQSRIKSFQKEVESRTISKRLENHRSDKRRLSDMKTAAHSVFNYLYVGNGEHSWATQVLPIVNVKRDIDQLNGFVLEALRAVHTGKTNIGGLGYVKTSPDGCIVRGKGRNVKANRSKVPGRIECWLSIGCAQNALLMSPSVYRTLVSSFY